MIVKIFAVGMILLVSSACLPHQNPLYEKRLSHPSLPQENPSPMVLEEAETSPPQELPAPLKESEPSDLLPPTLNQSVWQIDFPICDESTDDFTLEVLPKDPSKPPPEFDIPIVINERVEHFIQYFQTTARNRFSNWLARSEKYIPFMRNHLRENGLPEDLVYMALIESGFNPYAYSRSKASGPWQFISMTGKRYGLRSNYWIDERRDPEKSTIAAAKYLKDLYDLFECWYLAAAGYNAGEGKIATAMKRYRTEDFWELTKYQYLKRETKDYVPQLIAAALIAKDPEKYGFVGIEYDEPIRYEKVKVPEVTDLRLIAQACEVTLEEIKSLNPELSRWCTPPNYPDYEIKIPFGKKEFFLKNFETLSSGRRFQFKTHTVKKGENFSKIARLYQIDVEPILEINRLNKKSRLSIGMDLLIPLPNDQGSTPKAMAKKNPDGMDRHSTPMERTTYTVKKGDSLWGIANKLGVSVEALSRWNNFPPEKKLMPGDQLKIKETKTTAPLGSAQVKKAEKEFIYIVKEGDNLWNIAKRFNLNVSDIMAWNHLNEADRIYPEDRLKLKGGEIKSSTLN